METLKMNHHKIDNFDRIRGLLEFPNDKTFYFLQILQRKKDFKGERIGGSNNNSRCIKTYYITSREHLDTHKEEIVKLCQVFGARAGINLNPRNFERAAFNVLQLIANQMANADFYSVRKAYDSVCGLSYNTIDKRWLIDIDSKDEDFVAEVVSAVQMLQSTITNRDYRILSIIETKSGCHIITNPFNLAEFTKFYPRIDVHKNNPTLLYYEWNEDVR